MPAEANENMAKEKEFRIERSIPDAGVACIQCHKREHPGIFADWANSGHASANITCIDCHKAEEHDPAPAGIDRTLRVFWPP